MGIKYCSTAEQAANIMTKGFTNPEVWDRAISLIGIRPKDDDLHAYGINVPPPKPKPPKKKVALVDAVDNTCDKSSQDRIETV